MQKELQAKGYYCQDCNSLGNVVTEKGSENVDPAVLLAKIKHCYEVAVEPELTEGPSDLDASVKDKVLEAVGGTSTTFSKVRHNLQDACLVQKMLANGVLTVKGGSGKVVVVELGAGIILYVLLPIAKHACSLSYIIGRGMLGLAIMSVLPAAPTEPGAAPHLLMIERNGLKFKADKLLRERSMGHNRVRMDIRHCFLPKLPVIADYDSLRAAGYPPTVVLVAKHLCGLATDLSVSSIHHLVRENTTEATSSDGPAFQGLAIATCCHHACSWVDYTGIEWLCTEQGFTEAEFGVMKQWSGWAHTIKFTDEDKKGSARCERTSGTEAEWSAGNDEEEACCEHSAPVNESTVRPADLSSREMSDVGKMVKRILDQGRVMYLRRLGLPARQVRYCDPSLSPECYMIIATTGTSDSVSSCSNTS